MIAVLYHERQQKLSCDVPPADLGLVAIAVAVVAVLIGRALRIYNR